MLVALVMLILASKLAELAGQSALSMGLTSGCWQDLVVGIQWISSSNISWSSRKVMSQFYCCGVIDRKVPELRRCFLAQAGGY